MGRFYQALMRAEKEQRRDLLLPQKVQESFMFPALLREGALGEVPEWFREIKTRLQTNTTTKQCKSFMFTGISRECGCTSTLAGFAASLSNSFGHRVLLVDFNFRFPKLQDFFQIGSHEIDEIFQKMGGILAKTDGAADNLCVVACDGRRKDGDYALSLIDSPQFLHFMNEMKARFDFILIDTPPITMCSESRSLASKVDGVVLVVESGKSRIQIAKRAQQEIKSAGGMLVGVIFNRRKFHIPKWLYRRL
jgi:Mrp family chromosome partitioning ATPase